MVGAWVPIIQQSFVFLCVGYRTFLLPFAALRLPPPHLLTSHV